MKQDELNEILESHKLWLCNEPGGHRANLSGADLFGVDLRRANLSGADLFGVDLRRANLSGANLSGANLFGVDLRRANLSGANLSGTDLSGANLSGANLSGANLRGANLFGANLFSANLSGANLSGANLFGCIGNGNQIKTIQSDKYIVNFHGDIIQIGCERHTFDEWMDFDDERISDMGHGALEWWKTWKPIVKQLKDIYQ